MNIRKLKDIVKNEQILVLDLCYLKKDLELFIKNLSNTKFNETLGSMRYRVIECFLSLLKDEDKNLLFNTPEEYVALVLKNIFKNLSLELCYILHEGLSDLLGLIDIYYPYEQHKWLYLKQYSYSEWGCGAGEISLHSDDIYESRNIAFLSLSVCKDETNTHTTLLPIKELVSDLSDSEFQLLFKTNARFVSGKNVADLKEIVKPLAFYHEKEGLGFNFDFRVDEENGERMIGVSQKDQAIINQLRENLSQKELLYFGGEGSFLFVLNKRVLHGREKMKIEIKNQCLKENFTLSSSPRVVLRSKGIKRELGVAI